MESKAGLVQSKVLPLIENALDKISAMSNMAFRNEEELKNLLDEIKMYTLLLKEIRELKKAASVNETA